MKTEARKSDVWSDSGECVSGWTCIVTIPMLKWQSYSLTMTRQVVRHLL
jgi:hypothetical protein